MGRGFRIGAVRGGSVRDGHGPRQVRPVGRGPPGLPIDRSRLDPEDLAEDAALLLTDCSLREAQIESALRSGAAYTWELTADRLVRCYRSLLAQPQR